MQSGQTRPTQQSTFFEKPRPLHLTIAQWLSILFAVFIVGIAIATSLNRTPESEITTVATEASENTETKSTAFLATMSKTFSMSTQTHEGHISPYMVSGYAFDTGLGAATPVIQKSINAKESTSYLKSIRDYMDKNGYKESVLSTGSDDTVVFDSVFVTSDIICEITNTENDNTSTIAVSCVDISQLRNYAKAQSVFFDVYAAHMNAATLTIVGYPMVEKSKIFGFETATITVGDPFGGTSATAYFYRTPTNTSWQYFTTSDKVIACSSFTSEDIRYAFTGLTCYDAKTERELTVSIDLK